MVKATSPSLEQGSLPQLVRHPFKESKAEETRKKEKMTTIKKCQFYHLLPFKTVPSFHPLDLKFWHKVITNCKVTFSFGPNCFYKIDPRQY